MKRRLGILFRSLCLLIFLLSALLWARSYFVNDRLTRLSQRVDPVGPERRYHGGFFILQSSRGRLGIALQREWFPAPSPHRLSWSYQRTPSAPIIRLGQSMIDRGQGRFGPIQVLRGTAASDGGWVAWNTLLVPDWIFLPVGIPPLVWLIRRRRRGGRGFAVLPQDERDREGAMARSKAEDHFL